MAGEYHPFQLAILVLNLIINGLPSKPQKYADYVPVDEVLNLIINGLPSKQQWLDLLVEKKLQLQF